MLTASKAFIAFCLLAVGGTVLVIGPTELRRLLPMGAKTDIAAKPEPKVEHQAGRAQARRGRAAGASCVSGTGPRAEGGCAGRDAKAGHGRACRSCTGQAAAGGCR
ncbi:hypothetical protein ACVWWO_004334 [Bradyrhizobium sp. F1.13.1]